MTDQPTEDSCVGMPERADVEELVNAHAELDDPMETAIWIRQEALEVCLVEILPSMSEDEHPERPTLFNPGISFRFPLRLWAGNRQSIEQAIERDVQLAQDIARGDVLYGEAVGEELKALAVRVSDGPG